jgi:hypothetical protein
MTMPAVPNNPQRKAFENGVRDGQAGRDRKLPSGDNESLKRYYNDGFRIGSARRQLALLRKARQTAE